MNSDRWQHVQTLYFNALELPPDERNAFLERECRNDAEVQLEVRSLLQYRDKIGNFLTETAIQAMDGTYGREESADGVPDDLIGTVIADRYIVSEFLGSGGMGSVYRATHRLLGNSVAIKRIASRFRHRKEFRERFVEEARKAVQLDHDNITKVFDAVEESGEVFVVMEFVEGQTLRNRLKHVVNIDDFLEIAIQCASALVAAHRQRIVHLDLKPENIMLTGSHKVKVCDFGVARQFPAEADVKTKGSAGHWTFAGTPAYMAPEVMQSNRFDSRADLFSLGLVFYETLAGKHPFLSDDVATTTTRIMNDSAMPLSSAAKKLPWRLVRLVERMLAKNPEGRPKSAEEILQELQTIRRHHGFIKNAWDNSREIAVHVTKKPLAASAIASAAILAVLSFMWALHSFHQRTLQQELAVLPFKNVGDDPANQAFCDGIVETLTNKLAQLDQLQNAFRVEAASEMRGITSARDAHRTFGVALAITGSVQRIGDSVDLTINLVDAATGTLIHGSSMKTEIASLSGIEDDIVIEVTRLVLHSPISQNARQVLNLEATGVPAAYDTYVQGLGYLQRYENTASIDRSIELFNQALMRDDTYALAWAALGQAYWRKYDLTKDVHYAELGRENCQKALDLNKRLAQVYVTLALISNGTGRYEDAIDQAKKSLEINPISGQAYQELAKAYQGVGKLMDAEEAYHRAIQERSNDWATYNDLGRFYDQRGRYPEAETQFLRVVNIAPDNVRGWSNLGGIYQKMNRYPDAEKMLKKSLEIRPSSAAFANLGTIYYFHLKRPTDAARMFEKAVEIDKRDYRIWRNLAAAYYWSPDERPKARAAYQQTIELGEQDLLINSRNPRLLMHLADSYAMTDQPGRALQNMEKAMNVAPPDNDSMAIAAGIYEKLGQRAQAVQWIAAALCAGYSRELVDSSPDLAELRSDPSFQAATNPEVLTQRRRETQCQKETQQTR